MTRGCGRSSTAPQPDLIGLFVVPLNTLDIAYMVTGAVAAVVYGEPRMTRDLDVVVDLEPADADRLGAAFPAEVFYVPPREVIAEEAARPLGGHFNLIHHETALRADCYVAGEDALHAWALPLRKRHVAGDVPVWLAPIEYVIVRKLDWFRMGGSTRHLDDIRAMLRISGSQVDRAALAHWLEHFKLTDEWARVQQRP